MTQKLCWAFIVVPIEMEALVQEGKAFARLVAQAGRLKRHATHCYIASGNCMPRFGSHPKALQMASKADLVRSPSRFVSRSAVRE